ncbi:HYOU1_3 [Blepharisma stoltei]|uniref:Hypoxia up-regulated protein 1 n=1 Tax=Blepharisma stoltei TaxID=1481888 RepID=A0AAU9IFE1_9CILI|nr:unnamed protein product [Blepharisma stoltei]
MKNTIFLFYLLTFLATASVIGIDFGTDNFKISLIRPGKKLVIVENEHSKRATPSAIAFTEQGRLFGENALKEQSKKPDLAIAFPHRLLGIPYTDVKARQNFLSTFQPIELFEDENRTSISYRIKGLDLTNEEVVVMVLEHAKKITEKFAEGHVKDCTITVPSFWTRAQRFALIYSAYAAGLNVLSFVNENTAAAFYYGIDRLDNTTTHRALFYNLGASYLQVTIAEYSTVERMFGTTNKQIENIQILAHASDKYLGGSFFDKLLAEHFVEEFQKSTGLNARESSRAMIRLFHQAQSTKKTLSASKVVPVTVNSLYKEKDLKITLTRDAFEEMMAPFLDKLVEPVNKALEIAGLTIEQINSFELIGGVSRIPKVQDVLKDKLKVELGTHLNGDEAMAHGAALFAANYSQVVHVKPLWLTDINLYNVTAQFYTKDGSEPFKTVEVFPYGVPVRNLERVILKHTEDLKIILQIAYGDKVVDALSYDVHGIQDLFVQSGKEVDLLFLFALDSSNLPFLYEVHSRIEVNVVKKVPKQKDKKVEEEKATEKGESEKEESKNEDKVEEDNKEKENTQEEGENKNEEKTSEDSKEKEEHKDTEAASEVKNSTSDKIEYEEITVKEMQDKKLEFNETDLEIPRTLKQEAAYELMTRIGAFKTKEEEKKRLAEVKNDLESYIYFLREKLEESAFIQVTQENEREEYSKSISETHDWMESAEYTIANSTEIKKAKKDLEGKIADALEREKESEIRDQAVADALAQILKLEEKLVTINATKPWIPKEEMAFTRLTINNTRSWISERVAEQKAKNPWDPLAFKTSEISSKVDQAVKQVEKLQRMQKPKPKVPEFMNFGKDFDWSKVKMENVTVDGESYSSEDMKNEEKKEEDKNQGQKAEEAKDEKEKTADGESEGEKAQEGTDKDFKEDL